MDLGIVNTLTPACFPTPPYLPPGDSDGLRLASHQLNSSSLVRTDASSVLCNVAVYFLLNYLFVLNFITFGYQGCIDKVIDHILTLTKQKFIQ